MINLIRGSPKSPDYKRPPLRQSNGFHSPSGRPGKYEGRNGKTSCLRKCFSVGLYSSVLLTILFAFTSVVVYVNCSSAIGYEIIPKSHQLCHDIYQTLQTGRIAPLTWDYKASFAEVSRITQGRFTAVVDWFKKVNYADWFKNINFAGLKDRIVTAAVSVKDAIIGFPTWISENGGQLGRSAWNFILKYSKIARNYVYWVGRSLLKIGNNGYQWCKESAKGAFANIQKLWQEPKKGAVPEKAAPEKLVPEKSVPKKSDAETSPPKKSASEKSIPKTERARDDNSGPE